MIIGKSTHDAAMAEKDAEIAELMREIAKTGVLLTEARAERDAAWRTIAHLRTDIAAQGRQITELLPLAEKARRMTRGLIPGGPKALAKQQARAA